MLSRAGAATLLRMDVDMTLSAARHICQHPPQADSRMLRPLFSAQIWPPACPEALGWRWVSALTHPARYRGLMQMPWD